MFLDDEKYGIDPKSIMVFDYKNKVYIKASKAWFVRRKSTSLSKDVFWAFSSFKDAKEYGKPLNLKDTKAQISLTKNKTFFWNMVSVRYLTMANKIAKACDTQDLIFFGICDAQEQIAQSCPKLKPRHVRRLAFYLLSKEELTQDLEIPEDAKCPVCGMFVAKYPKWASQITYFYQGKTHTLSFDGMKDLMKFYFDAQKWGKYPFAKTKNITSIKTLDFYTQKPIEARKAFFVIRSDVYGPMGNEFIGFSTNERAEEFLHDHSGKKILQFKEITQEMPYELDKN